jgi:hypothetical protein
MVERSLANQWSELSGHQLEGLAAMEEDIREAVTVSVIRSGAGIDVLRKLRRDLFVESQVMATLTAANDAESAFYILSLALQALVWADADPVSHFTEFKVPDELFHKWELDGVEGYEEFVKMVAESTLTESQEKIARLLRCPCCGKSGVDVLLLTFFGLCETKVYESEEAESGDYSDMFSALGHEALTYRQFVQLPALLVEQLRVDAGRSVTLADLLDGDLKRDMRLLYRREKLVFSEGLFCFVEPLLGLAMGIDEAFKDLCLPAQGVADVLLCTFSDTKEVDWERYAKFCSEFGYSHGLRSYALFASEVCASLREAALKTYESASSEIAAAPHMTGTAPIERSFLVSDSCPGCGDKPAGPVVPGRTTCASCGLGIVRRACQSCSAPAVVRDNWGRFMCRCGKSNTSTPIASLNELGTNAFWSMGGLTFAAGVYLEARESYLDLSAAIAEVLTSVSFFDYALNGLLTGAIAAGTTIAVGKVFGYRWE